MMRPLVIIFILVTAASGTTLQGSESEPVATWTATKEAINELTFSPDGRLVGSADEGGDIKLWDSASHQLVSTLKSHVGRVGNDVIGAVRGIAFSPDGKTIASVGGDEKVKLWDVATGQTRKILGEVRNAMSLAYSPDGNSVATVGDLEFKTTLCVFDAKAGRQVGALRAEDLDGLAVVFSPDSSLIATSGNRGQVLIWDVKAGKLALRIKTGSTLTLGISFAPDGKTFAVCGAGSIKVFETKTGREVAQMEGRDTTLDLKFSPDGKRLAASTREGQVKVWDVASRKELASFEGHENFVRTLAFSPDGRTIASGDKDGVVNLWRVPGTGVSAAPAPRAGNANPAVVAADPKTIALRFDGIVRPGEAGYHPQRTSVRLRFGPGQGRGITIRSSIAWGNGNQGRDHWGVGSGEPTYVSDVYQDAEGHYFVFSLNGTGWTSDRVGALIRLTLPDGKPGVAMAQFPCR